MHNALVFKRLKTIESSSCQNLHYELSLAMSTNAEQDAYVIQRQYATSEGKKSTRNIISTRISNIPTLIEQLQNCYDEYRKKKVLEKQTEHIIIDEYDINSYQSTYRKELAKIYVESMTKNFTTVLQERCLGCQFQESK